MRSKFITVGIAALAIVATLSGCSGAAKPSTADSNSSSNMNMTSASGSTMTAADMNKMDEAVMKAFPAKTQGQGGVELKPTMDGDVKVFNLTVSHIKWEVSPGKTVDAMAYNGMVPGPTIHVTEGDKFRVVVKNDLGDEPTTVHWHGLLVQNDQDGVPYMTQPPINPGQTFTYNLVAQNPGTQFYHSHDDSTKQVTEGLYGALIIDPKDQAQKNKYPVTQDVTMMLGDGSMGFTINGKEFPATSPVTAKLGDKIRVRYINAGQLVHTMHLHGLTQLVVAKDGYDLPTPYKADTILIGPGERYDVIVDANNPGTWAWHCHVLGHAEGDKGMFGMVTAMIVNK